MDFSLSGFDRLIFMILVLWGPLCTACLVIFGFVQMGKPTSWMTRFCYGLSISLFVLCLMVILHEFNVNNSNTSLLGLMIIGVVIFGISVYGFNYKLKRDKSIG
jgi:drug/metabolite transporter (DMT)-like permease